MRRIRISAGDVTAEATLLDTGTARSIWAALPFRAPAATWGDEIYFSIPLELGPDDGRALVAAGDLAYWPPGQAFCIFFGPTPASRGSEIRPASPVSVFGRLEGNPVVFRRVVSGAPVLVERASDEPPAGGQASGAAT